MKSPQEKIPSTLTVSRSTSKQESNASTKPRSYFRWHWSTIFLTLIPAALFLLVTFPCSSYIVSFGVGYDAFGWPAVHCIRSHDEDTIDHVTQESSLRFTESLPFYKKHFYPERTETWNYADKGSEFQRWLPAGMVVNLLTGLLIFGSLGMLLERRCRNRRSIFQLTIGDLLMVVFAVSAGFALSGNVYNAAKMHCQADFLLRRHFNNAPNQRQGADGYAPTWVNHLTVGNLRMGSTEVQLPDGTQRIQPLYWRIGHVRGHGSVKRVHVHEGNDNYCIELKMESGLTDHLLCSYRTDSQSSGDHADFLRSIADVKTLHVNSREFNPPHDFGLPVFDQLTRLVVHDGRIDEAIAQWVLLQPALEFVDVKAGFINDCQFGNLSLLFPDNRIEEMSEFHRRIHINSRPPTSEAIHCEE